MQIVQALVSIPFYGDTILAMQDPDGKIWVSLKRLCEALGIDYAAQYTKLRSANYRRWATVVIIPTVAADGKPRDTVMIDTRTLWGWLFTISPSKIAFELREKLDTYKAEVLDTLEEKFNGKQANRLQLAKMGRCHDDRDT